MDNITLKDAKIKINVAGGADQTLTVDVKGDTFKEQIVKLEEYANNAKKNIEGLGTHVQGVQISFGQNTWFDFGRIFR